MVASLQNSSAFSSLAYNPQPRLQHLPHCVHPGPQGRVDQVGIPLGGPDLGVAQQPPNHFQRGSTGHQQGCKGMAQIVDTDVSYIGLNAHAFPEPLEIDHRLGRDIAGEEKGAALRHGIVAQPDQRDSLIRDWHAVNATLLGIGRLLGPRRQIEIELIEARGSGLAATVTGQHAEADDPGGTLIGVGAESVGEALDFFEGQEPLAGRFGTFAEAGGRVVGAHFPRDS